MRSGGTGTRRVVSAWAAIGAFAILVVSARADSLRVIDTAPNDVLNVREYPTTQSRIIGMIPPNGRGIAFEGEARGTWLFVRYGSVEGWVSARFVAPDAPPVRRGRVLEPNE